MRGRHRPGLRGQLTLAFIVVGGLTLAVTAIAIFSPLQHRLQNDELRSLSDQARSAAARFSSLPPRDFAPRAPALRRVVRDVRRRGVAQVLVVDASGRVLAGNDVDADLDISDVRRAAQTGQPASGVNGSGSEAEARVAVGVRGRRLALALRDPLDEVQAAQRVFRTGFILAAIISLAVALASGALLAARLVRRLRSLRDTALLVAELGPKAEMRTDDAQDEVGDLTRAFALMQERLAEQEDARRNFVATASHELRTPLTALQLRLGLLREDIAGDAPDLDDAQAQVIGAEMQAARLARLAADLLDLSRIDAGVPLRRELLHMGSLCRVTLAEFDVPSPGGAPRAELVEEEPCDAVGDPRSTVQILRIMVDNARKFAPAGSIVRVHLRGDETSTHVTVEDDGPGVPDGDEERIFRRFERGRESNADPGFGLGLAIGRELARLMDGELAFAGNRPTRFALTLPRIDPWSRAQPAPAPPSAGGS